MQYQLNAATVLNVVYAGAVTRHLQSTIDTNTLNVILPATADAQAKSIFPDFARGGSFVIPEPATNDNGLQLDVTLRTLTLALDTKYTYSKCLGDARDIVDNDIGSYRAPYAPGLGIGVDYALCDTFYASRTFVLGRGQALLTHRFESYVAGGWSLQNIATVQDAQPLNIACTTTIAAGLGCNLFIVPGHPPYAGAHNATQFLNPAVFANSVANATGIAALGGSPTQVTGPVYRKLDASLFRQIPLAEGTCLEIRAEAFNVTNTPSFSAPGTLTFTSPTTFASITSTRDSSRQLRYAAKIYC